MRIHLLLLHIDWSKIQDAKNLYKLHFIKKVFIQYYTYFIGKEQATETLLVMSLTCNKKYFNNNKIFLALVENM